MLKCKNCSSTQFIKSGMVNHKQRYRCKGCGCHFTEGDGRTNARCTAKKAMCVVLYSLGKASFRTLSKIFHTSPSLTYRWVIEAGCGKHNKETRGEIKYMEFDRIGNFIKTQGTNFEPSKQLAVASGELWPGYSAIVILQPLSDTEEKPS